MNGKMYIPDINKYPGINKASLPQAQIKLVCTTGSHNKFYRLWIETVTVHTSYGAIGISGIFNCSKITYANKDKALTAMITRAKSKRSKGYIFEEHITMEELAKALLSEENLTSKPSSIKMKITPEEAKDKFNSFLNGLTS